MGECLPRRVPPDSRTRLDTIVKKMIPPDTGSTWAEPIDPWTDIATVDTIPTDLDFATQVNFWYDHKVIEHPTGIEALHLTWLPLTYSEHVYLDGIEQEQHATWERYEQDIVVQPAMQRATGQLLECRYAYQGQGFYEPIQLPDVIYSEPSPGFAPNSHWRIANFLIPGYDVVDDPGSYACAFTHAIEGNYNTLQFWTLASRPCFTIIRRGGFDGYGSMIVGDAAYLYGVSPTAPDEIAVYASNAWQEQVFTNVARFSDSEPPEWFTETGAIPPPEGAILLWETTPDSGNYIYTGDYLSTPSLPHASVASVRISNIVVTDAVTPDETTTAGIWAVPPGQFQYVFEDINDPTSPELEQPWHLPEGRPYWASPTRVAEVGTRLGTVSSDGTVPSGAAIDVPLSLIEYVETGHGDPAEGTGTYPRLTLVMVTDNQTSGNPPDVVDDSGDPLPAEGNPTGILYKFDRFVSFVYVLEWTLRPPRFVVVEAAP